jgi:ATP-binding cassette subfamily B (MDR/TAP) protein 1
LFQLFFADLVQQGMSENVAMVANMLGAFSTGFILAYARSWRLSLALSSIIPFLFLSFSITTKFVSKYNQASLQHVSNSGTIAEEVISTVRTAHAFGTQATLADIFDMYCNQSKEIDSKAAIVQGAGLSIFFFVMYSAYALAFSFGTTLINEGRGW